MGKELLCWASEGANATSVAASLQLHLFAATEGLTLNLSIWGSWDLGLFLLSACREFDMVHLCSQGCVTPPCLHCPALPCLSWEAAAQGWCEGVLPALWLLRLLHKIQYICPSFTVPFFPCNLWWLPIFFFIFYGGHWRRVIVSLGPA